MHNANATANRQEHRLFSVLGLFTAIQFCCRSHRQSTLFAVIFPSYDHCMVRRPRLRSGTEWQAQIHTKLLAELFSPSEIIHTVLNHTVVLVPYNMQRLLPNYENFCKIFASIANFLVTRNTIKCTFCSIFPREFPRQCTYFSNAAFVRLKYHQKCR